MALRIVRVLLGVTPHLACAVAPPARGWIDHLTSPSRGPLTPGGGRLRGHEDRDTPAPSGLVAHRRRTRYETKDHYL